MKKIKKVYVCNVCLDIINDISGNYCSKCKIRLDNRYTSVFDIIEKKTLHLCNECYQGMINCALCGKRVFKEQSIKIFQEQYDKNICFDCCETISDEYDIMLHQKKW